MVLKYNYLVSFADTVVGNVATTSYSVKNESKNCHFFVEQHPNFDSTLNPFTVKKKPGKYTNFEVVISYRPTVPYQKNVNYFLLKNEEKSIVLCVKGQSKELTVTASVSELIFYRLRNENKTKATFELSNSSKKSVQFQFDIDVNQDLFYVEPVFGEIAAGKRVYINITFIRDKPGVFYLPLACMILYYEPIIIELMAINAFTENKTILNVFQRRTSCFKFESFFEKYCNLNSPEPSINSVCSLSKKYVDFSTKNTENLESTVLVEIKNNSDKCIRITFDTENEKIFTLEFPKACLEADESGFLECKFTPNIEDKLYGRILYGRAVNVDNDIESNPMPLILRTIGSSFTGHNTWFPRVQIHPETILMPVVIPKEKVYSTFQMENLGQFPVVFKFISPPKTHFSILPVSGIIENNYQIFVVQFSTDNLEDKSYQETWNIELNYMSDSRKEICLKALVQNPRIKVGRGNTLSFGNIFPGCEQHLTVPVTNLTQLSLRYQFYNNQWILVENNIGEIHNHETVHLKWTYTADLQVPETFELKYELSVLQNGSLQIGSSVECSVTVFAQSSYAKLCTTPNYNCLSELVCNEQLSFSFNIFNFGNCQVNFKLKVIQNFDIPGSGDISIVPNKGTLNAKENMRIEGTLEPTRIGPGTFCIKYYVTRSPICDHIIDIDDTIWPTASILYTMNYCSAYPILKIVDIGKNKAGPLFGKLNIWEFFQIERLNSILKHIKANQTINFDVNIPEAQAAIDITKMFTFIIKNTSNIDTTCKIERKKNCDCNLKELHTNTSIRKYSYEDCPHRKILNITISDESIRAQDIQYIVVEVFYNLYGSHTMLHTMNLSHNRTVNLYFHIKGLEPSNLSIFTQHLTFPMYNVYIGEMDADLQIFWFYNNTRKPASYFLDTDILDDMNMHYHTNVLTCLNPKDKVDGKNVHALIFKFSPIHTDFLEIQLPLFLGGIKHYFKIYGRGTMYYRSPIDRIAGHGPTKEIYYHPGLLIHISTEHIIIPAISTYSGVTRIFCLKNISKDNSIAFCFESYYRKNVVYATVEPAKGVLKPREHMWLKIRLYTYGQACTIRITCSCHLLDKTALLKHIQSCTEYHQEATILHHQFEITEKGTTYPKSTITLEPQPKIFHRILAMSCHIVGTPDRDCKMSLHQQLKQLPVPHISIYTCDTLQNMFAQRKMITDHTEQPIHTLYAKKIMKKLQTNVKNAEPECEDENSTCRAHNCPQYEDKMYALIHTVLECLIHDVVYSKKFRYFIESMQNLPDKYYAEFSNENFDLDEKRMMAKSILNHAPNNVISGVFEHLLYDCVKQHFKLCAQPVVDNNDDILLTKLRCRNMKTKSVYIEKFSFLFDDV